MLRGGETGVDLLGGPDRDHRIPREDSQTPVRIERTSGQDGAAPVDMHLNRMEAYVLLEAVRSPKGVVEIEHLDGPEEAKFTAAKRLETDGLVKLLGPSAYQITRKGRDPKLIADIALAWIRKKA